jgi:hypothetical protein
MKQPYPPAWSLLPQAFVRKERWLGGHKAAGMPLVSPGQDVVPDQPILRWQDPEKRFSGQASPDSAADTHKAPDRHKVVPAGLWGHVVGITSRGGVVIESYATLVQGVIGIGDQVTGILTLWHSDGLNNTQTIPPGAILVVPGPLTLLLLRQILASGVAGVVSSSIALRDLEGFLHIDLIEFLQEERSEQRMLLQQHFPPLTLLFTEGLGLDLNRMDGQGGDGARPRPHPYKPLSGGFSLPRMPANLITALSRYEGSMALLSGETSLRKDIVPELIISLPPKGNQSASPVVQPDTSLTPGARVRVYGGEYQGITGTLDYLFAYEQKFPSGLRARAARLRLEDGSLLIIPLFSLQRIG